MWSALHVKKIAQFSTDSVSSSNAIKKSSLYTRTGDKGTSMLFNGERRLKSDSRFEALGDSDELNSVLGSCLEATSSSLLSCSFSKQTQLQTLQEQLSFIQRVIFHVGSSLATPQSSDKTSQKHLERADRDFEVVISRLESWIDLMDAQLPPLTAFILPV